jgi:predicted lipoprotein with Yx(FWY)xxD motif
MRSPLIPAICAIAVVGQITLAAWAKSEAPTRGKATPAPVGAAAPTASKPKAAPKPAPKPAAIRLSVTQTRLGPVVVGPTGRTLYRFDEDSAKPPASNCAGSCAQTWPPLIVKGGTVVGQGFDGSLLGTLTRSDGTKQVTLNGWPLYYFAGDKKPGDLAGEGVDGVWHAIAPTGKPAAAAPTDTGYGG